MLVYLFEVDSVRNSKAEIIKGQQALFEEIVMNGNQVVLSFNQLTDSEAFLSILENEEAYEEMIGLFRCGALRVSQFGRFRTASQYIQNAIDKCIGKDSDAFLFSGLPVKCTDTELLMKIKDALAFGDLTLLEEIRDKYPVGSTDWKRLEYIQRYIRMILILSMEKLAMNPGKEQIEYSFVDYMKEIITICEKEPDEQLNQGAKLLKEISENLGVDKLRNNRTNWINYLNGLEANETIYIAEAMVDLCYNYTIEESISNVARHFEDREGFRRDLLNRFHQYWEEYCCKIHVFHKGDLEQIADMQQKQREYGQAKADAERILYQLKEVSKRKNKLLVEEINQHFGIVRWKLFDFQKNGEYKEVCIPTVLDEETGIYKVFGDTTNTGREIDGSGS